ncbi:MAG TPA: PhzF family phenazine biosynthesis protein [Acidobacteriota bacterium]|nr:PhzF family phenazine biosynthesis protein [Acidobacteriota bacterium]
MRTKIYQVDAFTNRLFQGNPAAVCPLADWLPAETMQRIGAENNLSETAFYVKSGDAFNIRWFTPTVEVDLCGHATLASAHVLFNHEGFGGRRISFNSRGGILSVAREGDFLVLDFPVDTVKEVKPPQELVRGMGQQPRKALRGRSDYMLVYGTEADVEGLKPDFGLIAKTTARGVIATARGTRADFVSRFFAPQAGIPEDPATGSSHTTLMPYWAKELGKLELTALQLSKRGGSFKCRLRDDRVDIAGQARTYLVGEIEIE